MNFADDFNFSAIISFKIIQSYNLFNPIFLFSFTVFNVSLCVLLKLATDYKL